MSEDVHYDKAVTTMQGLPNGGTVLEILIAAGLGRAPRQLGITKKRFEAALMPGGPLAEYVGVKVFPETPKLKRDGTLVQRPKWAKDDSIPTRTSQTSKTDITNHMFPELTAMLARSDSKDGEFGRKLPKDAYDALNDLRTEAIPQAYCEPVMSAIRQLIAAFHEAQTEAKHANRLVEVVQKSMDTMTLMVTHEKAADVQTTPDTQPAEGKKATPGKLN